MQSDPVKVPFGVWFDGKRPRGKAEAREAAAFLVAFGFSHICVLLNDTRNVTETWRDEDLYWLLEEIDAQGAEPFVFDWVWSKPERLEEQCKVIHRIEQRVRLAAYQQDCEESWRDDKMGTASEAFIDAYRAEGCETPVGVTAIAGLDAPSQQDVELHMHKLHGAGLLHHAAPQLYSARSKSIPWTMKTNMVLPGRTQRIGYAHWGDTVAELGVPVYMGMAGYGQNLFAGTPEANLRKSFEVGLELAGDFNIHAFWIWSRKHLTRMGKTARALRALIEDIQSTSSLPALEGGLTAAQKALVGAAARGLGQGLIHSLR